MATFLNRMRFENPVLTRELRTRMRGTRAFWILFVYLTILSLILFLTYLSWWQSQGNSLNGGGGNGAFNVGKTFYSVLFTVQALLVGLITPSLTAGGVSIEREQRTFDLLSLTLIPRRSIVTGKLFAAVSFVVLLLTSSLPLVSLGFLLGGISPAEVGAAYFLLIICAFLYGAVGIACSAVARNTTTATVMSYGTILVLFSATLPLTIMASPGFFGPPGTGRGGAGLTALNPIGAVMAGTTTETYFGHSVPAWLTALVINGLFGIILTLVAVHRLELPRTDRSGLLRLLTALLVGLLTVGAYGVFLPGNTVLYGNTFATSAVITIAAIPFFLLPVFATGEGLPAKGGLLSMLDPRRLRKGEAPSGFVFTLLLAALCGVILFLGVHYGPHSSTKAVWEHIMAQRLMVLLFSTMWAFGSLGLLLSAVLKNRWSAFAVLAALIVMTYLMPTTPFLDRGDDAKKATRFDSVVYLSPLMPAIELGDQNARKNMWKTLDPSKMAAGKTPLYIATPCVYGVLGLVFLVGAGAVHSRNMRRLREKPAATPEPTPATT
jgi:ABC-type transport system involved in multi-copper enzyme maturation permease subunit